MWKATMPKPPSSLRIAEGGVEIFGRSMGLAEIDRPRLVGFRVIICRRIATAAGKPVAIRNLANASQFEGYLL